MATATQGTAKTIDEGSTIQALALTKLAGGSDPLACNQTVRRPRPSTRGHDGFLQLFNECQGVQVQNRSASRHRRA
jgi:hypothetical protein